MREEWYGFTESNIIKIKECYNILRGKYPITNESIEKAFLSEDMKMRQNLLSLINDVSVELDNIGLEKIYLHALSIKEKLLK